MQTIGKFREGNDKFYTATDISKYCIELFQSYIPVNPNDILIEPSAGDGSFLNWMKRMYPLNTIYAYDIEPEAKEIKIQNYLDLDISIFPKSQKIYVIGNPPFGKQSSLAKKFIRKSAIFAEAIAFILPKSFKKESYQKVFPLNFHCILSQDLPNHCFRVNGVAYDVPCVFQIWQKKDYNRTVIEVLKPDYFEYINKEDNPNIAIRRVGVFAGKLICGENISTASPSSHYFIRLNPEINLNEFVKLYNEKIIYDFNNTVGPKSISKPELNLKLLKIYE